MAVDPANPATVWLVNGGVSIQRSTDSGASFQTVTTLSRCIELYSVAIDPSNASRVYVAGDNVVFETSDGGQTWSAVGPAVSSLYAAPSHIYTVGGSVPQTVFLAKFDPTLPQVIYPTYLWTGTVSGIALDGAGDVW